MRTTPFFSVYKSVVSRHGIDPDGDKVPSYTARAIVRAMNRRTRMAWRAWDWVDFSVTEERAYRQVWNASHQYLRVNANGVPDEIFYLPAISYFGIKPSAPADPPIGFPPGGTITYPNDPYWQSLSPLDPYVSFDQVCQKSIGRVIGIYKSNPRLDGFKHSGITFKVTENGIDLFRVSGPTIFVKYLLAPSRFTIVPLVDGKAYSVGNLVFSDVTGETYVSIVNNNTASLSDGNSWRIMPLPEVLAPYIEAGAYADCMRESHPVDAAIAQDAIQKSALAEAEAQELLQSEIDVLMAMGQRHSYQQHRPPRRWTRDGLVTTPTWQPGTVTTLTDTCKTDGVYPPATPPMGVAWQWHPEIVSLSGPSIPSLQGLGTVSMLVGSKVELVIGGVGQEWELASGAADATDPGQVAPADFNVASNNKRWVKTG